jgi:hypothetical protein
MGREEESGQRPLSSSLPIKKTLIVIGGVEKVKITLLIIRNKWGLNASLTPLFIL